MLCTNKTSILCRGIFENALGSLKLVKFDSCLSAPTFMSGQADSFSLAAQLWIT